MIRWLVCIFFHRRHWVQKSRYYYGGALFWCPKCQEYRSSD